MTDYSPSIAQQTIVEGSDFWTTAKIVKADGTPALITDISSWSVWIFDMGVEVFSLLAQAPVAIGSGGQFSNSMLGPDGYSDEEYNFRHRVLGASISAKGGHTYRVEYEIITTQFGKFQPLADITVIPVYHG